MDAPPWIKSDIKTVNMVSEYGALSIASIQEQLSSKGYLLIKNSPKNFSENRIFLDFIKEIGDPIEHNEGMLDYVWDIKAKPTTSLIKTFSEHNYEANLHTDAQYTEEPEHYLALLCITPAACGGGENGILCLADILDVAAETDFDLTDYYKPLFPFATPSVFLEKRESVSFRSILENSEKHWIRYRYDTLIAGAELSAASPEVLGLIERLNNFIEHEVFPKKGMKIRLEAHDLLLMSNRTVLHSRAAFDDKERHLLRIRFNM